MRYTNTFTKKTKMDEFRSKIKDKSVLKLFDELGGYYKFDESKNPSNNKTLEFRPPT